MFLRAEFLLVVLLFFHLKYDMMSRTTSVPTIQTPKLLKKPILLCEVLPLREPTLLVAILFFLQGFSARAQIRQEQIFLDESTGIFTKLSGSGSGGGTFTFPSIGSGTLLTTAATGSITTLGCTLLTGDCKLGDRMNFNMITASVWPQPTPIRHFEMFVIEVTNTCDRNFYWDPIFTTF